MRNLVLSVLVAAAGYGFFILAQGEPLPALALNSNFKAADECLDVERCIYVYVSPWCPSCQRSVELIKELRSYSHGSEGKVGMKIIVGRDSRVNMERFYKKIGGRVYLDPDGEFYDTIGAPGVPTWMVLDGKRRVKTVQAGVPDGLPLSEAVDYMIDKSLDLADYM